MYFLWPIDNTNQQSNDWFSKYGGILLIILSAILVVAFVVALVFYFRVRKSDKINNTIDNPNEYLEAFGGKENIVSCEAKTSRLIVVLNDYSKMNEEKLKSLGIESLIKATNKVTFIVGERAESIAKEINK